MMQLIDIVSFRVISVGEPRINLISGRVGRVVPGRLLSPSVTVDTFLAFALD